METQPTGMLAINSCKLYQAWGKLDKIAEWKKKVAKFDKAAGWKQKLEAFGQPAPSTNSALETKKK